MKPTWMAAMAHRLWVCNWSHTQTHTCIYIKKINITKFILLKNWLKQAFALQRNCFMEL